MLRFCYPNIVIGTESGSYPRTIDPDQLTLMFSDEDIMDAWLSNVDVFGLAPSFAARHTSASDAMVQRMIPILAARGIKFGIHPGGPLGYTAGVVTGLDTGGQNGILSAQSDLSATGAIGYMEALGATVDWAILDSPIDRVTLNGNNRNPHRSFRSFGSSSGGTFVKYTATAAGAAGNSIAISQVVSGTNTPLSVSASTVKVLADDFGRTETASWGTPDTGPAWTLTGTAANFSVSGGYGRMSVPTAGTTISAANATSVVTQNVRVRTHFGLDAIPTGDQVTASVRLRQQDASNYFEFYVIVKSDQGVRAGLKKVVAGVSTTLEDLAASQVPITFSSASKRIWIEARAVGTDLALVVWEYGTTRPSSDLIQIDDPDLSAGSSVELVASVNSGNTNLPRVFTWDELSVADVDQDGTAITVNLATNGSGAATSTANDVIAAVNADFDAASIVVASGSGTGTGVPITVSNGFLLFGDDGLNMDIHDTAQEIVAYIQTVNAARPSMLFGMTVDIRRPYDGSPGYSARTYPDLQMPDFADFWDEFVSQMTTAGLMSCFRLVMYDTGPEYLAGRITGSPYSAAIDWYARVFAMQRQVEADGVAFVLNFGSTNNASPGTDFQNLDGPASEASAQSNLVQGVYTQNAYRLANEPNERFQHFMFLSFGYYPRVQLPVSGGLSQADTYLKALAAFDPSLYTGTGTPPRVTASASRPAASAAAPRATVTVSAPRPR